MADGRQPGNAISLGFWVIVLRQDATDHVLAEVNTERMRDVTESRIAVFHFNPSRNDFLRRAFGPGAATFP